MRDDWWWGLFYLPVVGVLLYSAIYKKHSRKDLAIHGTLCAVFLIVMFTNLSPWLSNFIDGVFPMVDRSWWYVAFYFSLAAVFLYQILAQGKNYAIYGAGCLLFLICGFKHFNLFLSKILSGWLFST